MKRGTGDHPKISHLASLLGINEAWAVGLTELLFHFTAQYAPRGNVGKWANKNIASALYWKKGSDALVNAFVEAGWIDQDPDHRLIVHDWDHHADQAVRKKLARDGVDFIRPARTSMVYFIKATGTGVIKIGVSGRDVKERLCELQRNTMERLELIAVVDGGYTLEKELAKAYSHLRVKGEWYSPHESLLMKIRELVTISSGHVHPLENPSNASPSLPEPEPEPIYISYPAGLPSIDDPPFDTVGGEGAVEEWSLLPEVVVAAPDPEHRQSAKVTAEVEITAKALKSRHPAKRACGLAEITRKLEKCITHKQSLATFTGSKAEKQIALLRRIDANHSAWCATDQWARDEGEYAKGLANWLAHTEMRYLDSPPAETSTWTEPPDAMILR